MLTIYQTKEVILKWCESCLTEEQLDFLTDVIAEFIIERFSGKYAPQYPKVKNSEVGVIVDSILHELAERKLAVRLRYFKPLEKKEKTEN